MSVSRLLPGDARGRCRSTERPPHPTRYLPGERSGGLRHRGGMTTTVLGPPPRQDLLRGREGAGRQEAIEWSRAALLHLDERSRSHREPHCCKHRLRVTCQKRDSARVLQLAMSQHAFRQPSAEAAAAVHAPGPEGGMKKGERGIGFDTATIGEMTNPERSNSTGASFKEGARPVHRSHSGSGARA
jgi:hypothetical protein